MNPKVIMNKKNGFIFIMYSIPNIVYYYSRSRNSKPNIEKFFKSQTWKLQTETSNYIYEILIDDFISFNEFEIIGEL